MKRLLLGCLLLAGGCAPTPVDVQLGFPSLETFLYSDFGRLLVVEVDPQTGLGDCPAILERVSRGDFSGAALDSDWQPICAFADGTVRFPHVPEGPHAYVGLAAGEANTVLLAGCRIAEAYQGAPPVTLDLYPSEDYVSATDGRALSCGSIEDKCERGCR